MTNSMTQNRRIALNVAATYGRSLYVMIIGLFCGRWALQALGEVDFGLFGLVGGLTVFVSFFNGLLSHAVGRFYAVSVGAAKKKGAVEGLEDCRKWFNTALLIHTTVPVFFLIIGWPIGEWLVRNFLTIPADRVVSCLWVWRFTCITCFMGMLNVPFMAMYTAKQEIAELTIYTFITSTLNVIVLYHMITHPTVWLVKYALWTMVMSVFPQVVIVSRAFIKYPECRVRYRHLYDKARIKEILTFALARFWTAFSSVLSSQGNAILVNKYLGPVFNASMSIGGSVAGHAASLSASLTQAFWPAIANKAGEGDLETVRKFSFNTCRFGAILLLVFVIPLVLEMNEVMRIWLGTPPAFVSVISIAILIDIILERMSEGYSMAIMAVGRQIGLYSGWVSISGFSKLVLAWIAFACGYGIYGLCFSIIVARLVAVVVRLVLGSKIIGMSARYWLSHVFLPILMVAGVALVFGGLIQVVCKEPSFGRICMTSLLCELVFLPLVWFVILDGPERCFLNGKLCVRLSSFKKLWR